jgi:hypothetical protein
MQVLYNQKCEVRTLILSHVVQGKGASKSFRGTKWDYSSQANMCRRTESISFITSPTALCTR